MSSRQSGNASDQATFTSYLSASKEDDKTVLRVLANDTGGGPLSENNDLLEALQRGLDANRAYYTLGYYPEDTGDLRKFRSISVKVRNHPDYSVRAQKGYQPSEIAKEASREQSLTPEQRLVKAMAEPLAVIGLGVETSAYYYQRDGDPTQVHLLTYVSGDCLDYRLENERYQFKFEVVIHIYDLRGRPAWSRSETVSGNLRPDRKECVYAVSHSSRPSAEPVCFFEYGPCAMNHQDPAGETKCLPTG
jgi:hypothetical protein